MRRTRVAVVSDAIYPWHKGGKEVRYRELLSRLIDHDMDVTVYTMRWWDEAPPPVEGPRGSLSYRALCPKIALYSGARRSMLEAVVFALATLRLVFARFDAIEADHMPYLQIISLRLVAWLHRVPLVVSWHEVWGTDYWVEYMGPLGHVAGVLERICARLPDTLAVLTQSNADQLMAIGVKPDRITVVPCAVDARHMATINADGATPELLFVGRLLDNKRADLAVEAAASVVASGHDVRLGLVGVGPEREALEAQAATLGLTDRVVFYGAVDSHDHVWSLIKGAQVMVMPSEREGFGICVAEALMAGTPVVCSDSSGNESRHLVSDQENGSIVAAGDATAVADAIEKWLASETTRHSRVDAFRRDHAELDWDVSAGLYAALLHRGHKA